METREVDFDSGFPMEGPRLGREFNEAIDNGPNVVLRLIVDIAAVNDCLPVGLVCLPV
jgi:hypothetical protein